MIYSDILMKICNLLFNFASSGAGTTSYVESSGAGTTSYFRSVASIEKGL